MEHETDLKNHSKKFLTALKTLRKKVIDTRQRDYIDHLISKGDTLILTKPHDFQALKDEFDNKLKLNPKNKAHIRFKDSILKALGYEDKRRTFYPNFFSKIGIKACVYCNSQLCVTVADYKKKLIGKYQIDHFIDKRTYPCLSISLFNLYPVCASCNNIKRNKPVAFNLYVKDGDSLDSPYLFSVSNLEETVVEYLSSRSQSVIKLQFREANIVAGIDTLDSIFSILSIYETQIDLVEDLILKAHIYSKEYKEELIEEYKILFPDMNVVQRLILGNYVEPAEIHLRPMSKFVQDIGKQLGLI